MFKSGYATATGKCGHDVNRPRTLSAAFVKNVREPGRYGDGYGGHGLSLLVKPMSNGRRSKTWGQKLTIDGTRCMIGLGSYPVVTLSEARLKALANRRLVERGGDPRTRPTKRTRTRTTTAPADDGAPTFAEAAERVIALHEPNWRDGARSAEIWRSSLERFAYPTLGGKSVAAITAPDIHAVIAPLWGTKRETARRVKGRIAAVMAWAVAQGHRTDDPSAAVTAALPKNGNHVKHHRALPHARVAEALATVADSAARPASRLAFRFLVLTAARSGEVRGARWAEVDTDAATWTIPGDRTKTGKPHRVPLGAKALAVLTEAEALRDASGLLFPSVTGRAMTAEGLSKLCKDLSLGATPHGFRSSFRDWAGETGVLREVAEACLAHVVRGVEGAYARSDLLERRREVMAAWGAYVTR